VPLKQTNDFTGPAQGSVFVNDPWASVRSDTAPLKDQFRRVAEPLLHSLGLELFDLSFTVAPGGGHVQIFIDKPEGVRLRDCEQFSRLLGPALDVDDRIPDNYTLEVSSPGLDRPLRGKADYHRFRGKRVKIKTLLSLEGKKVFIGKLVHFDDETVVLQVGKKKTQEIPFSQIAHARLEIEWPLKGREERGK